MTALPECRSPLMSAAEPLDVPIPTKVDGTPADLAIMLAGIVESTMRRAIKPEVHDEFLREVLKVAEGMRSI
jgi:hypothetical protein